ncbi:glutaredoxin-3 [Cimex lectularius]|uniref:Glutaredoxin-3 n=1 Tax=Cimex lectularius TaxID=79782 RepID=A0A8I6RZD0_CIMLE|nr:glutaredoxin-3 [Cimex lectularius]XP_014252922.1 glutaredoxin-3 [Cimex lectularius]
MTGVLNLASADEFNTVLRSAGLMVCHFYADWVDQCRHMEKILIEMANLPEYKGVKFAKLQAEDVPVISHKYGIAAVPTILILRRNQVVDRVEGANPGTLISKLKQQINNIKLDKFPEGVQSLPAGGEPLELNERLKKLINKSAVMLFMKGSVDEPKCGFSRQIIDILRSVKADFKTFDILTDNEVREGLKKYSEWPTYPQLYVNGKLIGGLDVVKELHASGELNDILPRIHNLEDRLKFLIKKAPVMLFMKGNKEQPQCGFSRQMVHILNDCKVSYETFDILKDEDIRQGLKKFSNWPTYPQLYVRGELIGGLDVVKELQQSNQLLPALALSPKHNKCP